ncbi:mast cell-expressed membrane protein 1 isoform X1 [Rattus norvegicus]|uniref:mast cell-expressed membrane protein 1 isoform X1 n=1 Tax=Rattus norvegicus TaxID=10116 RepID=UPI0003D0DC67|nr:mast cell-expressed membrane protein 1 isoform X1 [Rattus norvegicus]|eukprot:XP_017453910.1 PREDICTED: mast cell-expressed membrane protein 1 isoform X3 [Rattus norvegicus]
MWGTTVVLAGTGKEVGLVLSGQPDQPAYLVGMCGQWGGPGPKAVVIYMNQPRRMQASASQEKNRRKPGHSEGAPSVPAPSRGAHNPEYENIAFRNRDQPKPSQSTPPQQVKFKPSPDTAQVPPWLHRSIMMLYVLLALVFLFCIILSALALVKNFQMSKELWTLKEELSNVSNTVWNIQTLQNQQKSIWEAVQRDIREAKSSLGTVKSSIQTGNDRLKTVPEDITQIKKTLEALEKKIQPKPSK